jgi:hypothetical protein
MGHGGRLLVVSTILLGLTMNGCGGGGGGSGSSDRRDPEVLSGFGTQVPEIVAEFRARLGADNGGFPERAFAGRREVNWDGVPDEDSSPGFLSPTFFDARTEPLARGLVTNTPGAGVQVSNDSNNPTLTPVRFGNINPTYPAEFETFSEERLFSPIGSNVTDVTFTIVGSPDVPALVRSFGVVFADVDSSTTTIELLAEDDVSLGVFLAPVQDKGRSFLGVIFPNAVIKKVRITTGNSALGPTDGSGSAVHGDVVDVVAMDDFIYAEPEPED